MNDTTFQGNGSVKYVPVVVNAKLSKPSRADRIRSMTDEELAKQIADWNGGDCPIVGDCMPIGQNSFTCEPWKCWLDWLQEEVSDG